MKMNHATPAAAMMMLLAGHAAGQVTVDGQIDSTEMNLYTRAFVQNQPTSFSDNTAQAGDPEDNSDAVNVTTGIEFAVPLVNFGLSDAIPTGQIRVAGHIISSSNDFLSNQVIGGLGGPSANLGDPANVSYDEPSGSNPAGIPGDQFVIVPVSVASGALIVDGVADAAYGAPIAVNNTGTGFGDNTDPDPVLTDGGSEIANTYATLADTNADGMADTLYVLVGGNLEENFNKLHLYFDVDADAAMPEGQNVLRDDNPDISFNGLNRSAGLQFDAGITPDFVIFYNFGDNDDTDSDPNNAFADMATLDTAGGGTGVFLGGGTPGLLTSGSLPGELGEGVEISINNSNVGGVGPSGFSPTIPDRDVAVGSELNALYTYIDAPNNRLNLLLAGNLESNGNRLILFFDGDPSDGQNTIRNDNVDISFRLIDRLGENDGTDPDDVDPEGPGLTFDAGFTADYLLSIDNSGQTTGTNTFFANAAVLRLNGPNIVQGFNTDFGSFDGGLKSEPGNDPLLFDGDNPPVVDGANNGLEPGTADNLFSNFAPRDAAASFLAEGMLGEETGGLLQISLDNSNIGGVGETPGGAVDDACNVTTGVEVSIDLTELGWDGSSDIKIAGGIANGGGDFWSNQVLGGLPAEDELGEPREINFDLLSGTQFVTVGDMGDCPVAGRLCADQNGDGLVTPSDFTSWVLNFNTSNLLADVNQDGLVTPADFTSWILAFNQGLNGPNCSP
ncbi:MAG: GC-type dockerin domain-anchored protein [Planctomycetota bacterium]